MCGVAILNERDFKNLYNAAIKKYIAANLRDDVGEKQILIEKINKYALLCNREFLGTYWGD